MTAERKKKKQSIKILFTGKFTGIKSNLISEIFLLDIVNKYIADKALRIIGKYSYTQAGRLSKALKM